MKWEEMKISLKDVISVGAILITILGAWYNTKMEIQSNSKDLEYLKAEFAEVKTEFSNFKQQVQGVMGYAIMQGWKPGSNWIVPPEPKEEPTPQPP